MRYGYHIVLLLVTGILFAANFRSGQFVLGWDNFNSEFNPPLAVSKALSAGWSDFRSFGLVAGMGYATDIIRALFVWLLHLALPTNLIRYTVHFLLLLTGTLGAFSVFTSASIRPGAAFVAALSYMLNFGTMQLFGLPYEPFSMFFAFLPWALSGWLRALSRWDRWSLVRFLIANVLLTGAFYVQTMFIVYVLVGGGISLIYLGIHRDRWRVVAGRLIILWLAIVAVNAYWLLTQLYFLADAVAVVRDAKQTLLGWRVPFFQNKAHGGLVDFFTQTGYYADFVGKGGLAFAPWLSYFSGRPVALVRFAICGVTILGILEGKRGFRPYALWLLAVSGSALLLDVPVFREINAWLRQSSFVDQVFRSPFSKFVVVQSLALSYFFGQGVDHMHETLRHTKARILLSIGTVIMVLLIAVPAFRGQLFSPTVRVTPPKEYGELFRFFDAQSPDKRIALLPELSVWGWYEYTWGYLGSGFLWHGIAQPIVSRSYDVWSRTSENYYWELTGAINEEDSVALGAVFRKYAVSYLVIDQSLVIPPKTSFKVDKMRALVEAIPGITRVGTFNFLDVYELPPHESSLFATATDLPNIGPETNARNSDEAYEENGTYETKTDMPYDRYYPFADLQSQTYDPNRLWTIAEDDQAFTLSATIPLSMQETHQSTSSAYRIPKVLVSPTNITQGEDCTDKLLYLPHATVSFSRSEAAITAESLEGATGCWGYHYDLAPQTFGYLIVVSATTQNGLPVSMYITDHTNQQTILQHQLNEKAGTYFFTPPGPPDGLGFSINFQNFSFKRTASRNEVSHPKVFVVPYALLKQLSYGRPEYHLAQLSKLSYQKKRGSWWYRLNLAPQTNATRLVFFQSFDPGWTAWEIQCKVQSAKCKVKQLREHVLVNNWSNGWVLRRNDVTNNEVTIILFFWPQLLQWFGFALIPLPFLWVWYTKHTWISRKQKTL